MTFKNRNLILSEDVDFLPVQQDPLSKAMYNSLMLRAFDNAEQDREESDFAACSLRQKLKLAEKKLVDLKRVHDLEQKQNACSPLSPFEHELGPVRKEVDESKGKVGPYRMVRTIGKGNFASVFFATHRVTGRAYAVKRLEKRRIAGKQEFKAVCRELKVMKLVRHTNVVRCHQVIHAPHCVYMVMGLGHQDLFSYLETHAAEMTPRVVREVAIGLLTGVEYLHSIGVAHLDIKPENILISKSVAPQALRRKYVQLCDLGLCEVAPDQNPMNEISVGWCGTPGFICPEMMMHQPCEGRQADMWSVGVTLLDINEGLPSGWESAWSHSNFELGGRAILAEVHMQPCSDFDIHQLIKELLKFDPHERLTAWDALHHRSLIDEGSCFCTHRHTR